MMDIRTRIGKLQLRNPTMLASGILGETGGSLLRVAKSGAAAIVTKSIGTNPREGYPNPTVVELDCGLLNAVGLANPGIEEYGKELRIALKGGVPVIGSIFGENAEEFSSLAGRMEDYGIHGIELNLSCPHVKGLGVDIGADEEAVKQITYEVKHSVGMPVFAKLTPNVIDISKLARAVEEAGGDAVVAINTLRAMSIVPEVGKPVLANKFGGLSGPAIKAIGVRCVYEIYEEVDIPIIGVGGVTSGRDALEYIMAGARAVQVGSAIHYRGLEVFKKICKEIEEFMEKNGYKKLTEMIGIAHE